MPGRSYIWLVLEFFEVEANYDAVYKTKWDCDTLYHAVIEPP